MLAVVDGLDTGPDALALVLFPCAGVETPVTVHVGAASIAWACLPTDAAEQAMVSALVALRSSLATSRRRTGSGECEASSARLAPVTRIVLTLALEDGVASDIERMEGGVLPSTTVLLC